MVTRSAPAQAIRLTGCLVLLAAPAQAETITLWVKAFIPNSGPAVFTPVPGKQGQTMLNGGSLGCYLTDQRGFSPDQSMSARMTSAISFDLTDDGLKNVSQTHTTGITHKVDCATGNTAGLCTDQANNLGMSFKNIQFDKAQKIASFTLDGLASNPCVQWQNVNPAPNIHYKVFFSFNAINKTWGLTAMTGQFPAFEGYITSNGGKPRPLFQLKAMEFNRGVGIYNSRVDIETTGSYR